MNNFGIKFFVLYFSPLYYTIKGLYTHNTYKEIIQEWNLFCLKYFKFSLWRINKQDIIHKKNIMYFHNHRSISDSLLGHILTNYNSLSVVRLLFSFIFMPYLFFGTLSNTIITINREGNIQKIFETVEKNRIKNKYNNIYVFPEGTRHQGDEVRQLKKGFIYHAFEHKISIQLIITKNNEHILNEKTFKTQNNVKIFVYHSKELNPENFKTKEEFYKFIQTMWNKSWNKVYNTKKYKYIVPFEDKMYNNKNKILFKHKMILPMILCIILFIIFI